MNKVCLRFPAFSDCIIEKTVSTDILKLIMDQVGIYEIRSNVFTNKQYSLDNLQFLDLSNNRIATIHPGAFNGLSRLTELRINYNRGRLELQADTFRGLTSLKILRMSSSYITRIDRDAFKRLHQLDELHLNDCYINEIPDNCFDDLYSITLIGLGSNTIKHLNPKLFKNTRRLNRLYACSATYSVVNRILCTLSMLRRHIEQLTELTIGLRSKDLPVLVILTIASYVYTCDFDDSHLEFMWRVAKAVKLKNRL